MKRKNDFKGGFTVSGKHPIESIEWILEENSNDDKIVFQAYDANLHPLPNISNWENKELINKQINKALIITKEFYGEVWLDDIKIKSIK